MFFILVILIRPLQTKYEDHIFRPYYKKDPKQVEEFHILQPPRQRITFVLTHVPHERIRAVSGSCRRPFKAFRGLLINSDFF